MSTDILISFDNTASMSVAISQVRRESVAVVKKLFSSINELRVAVIAHGDYCDGDKALTKLDFTTDQEKICRFIEKAPNTGGGDWPECYEYVLNTARALAWKGDKRGLILIGDDKSHEPGYRLPNGDRLTLDWRKEAKELSEMGIIIYAVQCLNISVNSHFYEELARITNGYKLDLNQFANSVNLISACCFNQAGKLDEFIEQQGGELKITNIDFKQIIADLKAGRKGGRAASKHKSDGLEEVNPSRFQALPVDEDCDIKSFVEKNGLVFRKGRGFYEFSKKVTIQSYKELVLEHKATGKFYTGQAAKDKLGIKETGRYSPPDDVNEYRVFVQSTSSNRKLLGGTNFLYEVDYRV